MAASTSNIQPDDDVLIEMYRRMLLIRKLEGQLCRDVKLGRTHARKARWPSARLAPCRIPERRSS